MRPTVSVSREGALAVGVSSFNSEIRRSHSRNSLGEGESNRAAYQVGGEGEGTGEGLK